MAEEKKEAEVETGGKKIDPSRVVIEAADFAEAMGVQMENLIKMAVPKSLAETVQKLIDEHETNIIEHDDEYAVLDISTASLQKNDCIPGYVDIVCSPAKFTKGGLMVKDRYPVKINFVPSGQEIYQWSLHPKEEWDKAQESNTGQMMSNEQMIASQILRTGGAI